MRYTFLRDIKVGENLDTRNNCIEAFDRYSRGFAQFSINSHSDANIILIGLNVNIRGFVGRRLFKQHIDKLDHRTNAISKCFLHIGNTCILIRLAKQGLHLVIFMFFLEILLNDILKLLPHSHYRNDLFTGPGLDLFDRGGILRIFY